MRRALSILLMLLLLPLLATAAPNITVSGNSVSILGTAQTISLTCTLIDPNQTGNLRSGSNIITVFVASTVTPGNVATCGPIYGNDVILDGFGNANTTYYKVQVFKVTGGIIASTPSLQNFYAFQGSGTVDLSTATPVAPSFMSGANGSVNVPGTFTVGGSTVPTVGANNAFTGNNTHSGTETFAKLNGLFYLDGTLYTNLNLAFAACNISPGCHLVVPPGSYSFSTQIAPTQMAIIEGAGATFQNTQTNCITTLTWTGGASAPFLFTGGAAQGSILRGFCLNATGVAPPVFVDIDNSAGNVDTDHIIIDAPTVQATVAGIRYGNTGVVNSPRCEHTFIRAAAPIAFDLLNVSANFIGQGCRGVIGGGPVTNEWVIGGTNQVIAFQCTDCNSEHNNTTGNPGVLIKNAIGFTWKGGYFECGGNATSYCVDIPNTATNAQAIQFIGPYAGSSAVTGTSAFVHSNLANAGVTVTGGRIGDSAFANPAYIIQDDAIQRGTISGVNCSSTGCLPFKNGAGKIYAYGNTTVTLQPDTIPASTLTSPVINGTPTGTGIATLTLKKGTGAGNYTSASTTYVVVDSTNLCNTVTIPTGWKLAIAADGNLGTATAAVQANAALTDNASCATANAGILVESLDTGTGASVLAPFSLNWVITGDGASHNIALQFKTSNAADSATLLNASATQLPTMVFTLMPSN